MTLFDALAPISNGRFVVQCANEFTEVVKAVRETGKKGSLTVTAEVIPGEKGTNISVVFVKGKTKKSIPVSELPEKLFFIHPQTNELTLEDTRQIDLDLDPTPEVELDAKERAANDRNDR